MASDSLSMPAFGLVIPCFNYESEITKTFHRLNQWHTRKCPSAKVFFVDDGSTDQTLRSLEAFCAANSSWCRLISLPKNRGKGAAVKAGFLAASEEVDYVLFTDCDLHYGLDVIPERLLPELRTQDVVLLDRSWCPTGASATSFRRTLASAVFNRLVGILAGIPFKDTQGGLKGFRVRTCKPLFLIQRIDGFAFDVELISLAIYYQLRISRIPIRFGPEYTSPVPSSIRLGTTSLQMLADLFRINLNWKRGLYHSDVMEDLVNERLYTISKTEREHAAPSSGRPASPDSAVVIHS